jgi:hypothetical protein
MTFTDSSRNRFEDFEKGPQDALRSFMRKEALRQ